MADDYQKINDLLKGKEVISKVDGVEVIANTYGEYGSLSDIFTKGNYQYFSDPLGIGRKIAEVDGVEVIEGRRRHRFSDFGDFTEPGTAHETAKETYDGLQRLDGVKTDTSIKSPSLSDKTETRSISYMPVDENGIKGFAYGVIPEIQGDFASGELYQTADAILGMLDGSYSGDYDSEKIEELRAIIEEENLTEAYDLTEKDVVELGKYNGLPILTKMMLDAYEATSVNESLNLGPRFKHVYIEELKE